MAMQFSAFSLRGLGPANCNFGVHYARVTLN